MGGPRGGPKAPWGSQSPLGVPIPWGSRFLTPPPRRALLGSPLVRSLVRWCGACRGGAGRRGQSCFLRDLTGERLSEKEQGIRGGGQNVPPHPQSSALTPPGCSPFQKCEHCRRRGATIPCRAAGCPRLYHFPCAAASGCFQAMKSFRLLCPEHVAEAAQMGACRVLGPAPEGTRKHGGVGVVWYPGGGPDALISRAEDARCVVCDGLGDARDLLFCTSCGQHYHGACLDIALTPRTRSGWQCPDCKVCQTCRWVSPAPREPPGGTQAGGRFSPFFTFFFFPSSCPAGSPARTPRCWCARRATRATTPSAWSRPSRASPPTPGSARCAPPTPLSSLGSFGGVPAPALTPLCPPPELQGVLRLRPAPAGARPRLPVAPELLGVRGLPAAARHGGSLRGAGTSPPTGPCGPGVSWDAWGGAGGHPPW